MRWLVMAGIALVLGVIDVVVLLLVVVIALLCFTVLSWFW